MTLQQQKTKKLDLLVTALFACLCATTGCMTSSREAQLQAAIIKVDQKVQDLQNEIDQKNKELASSREESTESRMKNQELKSEIEELKRQLALTQGAVDETKVKINRIQETYGASANAVGTDLSDPNTQTNTAERAQVKEEELLKLERRLAFVELLSKQKSGPTKESNTQKSNKSKTKNTYKSGSEISKLLNKAYGQEEYQKVISLASDALENHTVAEIREVALEFRGTAYFQEKNYEAAALDFASFVQDFPKSNRIARALLFAGDSFVYLKKLNAAKSYYLECANNFADKEEGKAAKQRLEKMGI